MAKILLLTILLTVTCFLGGVVSVTDKEFEVWIVLILYMMSQLIFNQLKLDLQRKLIKVVIILV